MALGSTSSATERFGSVQNKPQYFWIDSFLHRKINQVKQVKLRPGEGGGIQFHNLLAVTARIVLQWQMPCPLRQPDRTLVPITVLLQRRR
jgi:hypothetical protein